MNQEQMQEPQFFAGAEIGKGSFPLRTTKGAVIVKDGELTARDRTGDIVIAPVAIGHVRARAQRLSAGNAVRVWVGDSTYLLKWVPSAGNELAGVAGVAAGLAVAGGGIAGRTAASLPKQRAITKEFLALLGGDGEPVE